MEKQLQLLPPPVIYHFLTYSLKVVHKNWIVCSRLQKRLLTNLYILHTLPSLPIPRAKYSIVFQSSKLSAIVVAFSTLVWAVGECSTIHCLSALFGGLLFIVEISSRSLLPLFTPGSVHGGSASRDNCGWVLPDKLCVSSFPDRFPHYAWTAA